MYSVELYRSSGRVEHDPGWVECGGIRLACTPERWEEMRRQAGWAKTFGLPLELISAEEAQERFPLMVGRRRARRSWLPTDGYLDPSQLTYALAEGARARRLPDPHAHARDRDRRRAAAACAASRPTAATGVRGRRQRRRDVRRGDRPAGRRARADRPDGARVPRHPAVPRAHRGGHLPTMRDPDQLDLLPRGGRRPGDGRLRARQRAVGARRRRGLDAIPPDFNGRLLEEEWDRFEEIVVNARLRVPAMEDVTRHAADQRARGVHARRRVLPRGRPTSAGCSSPPGSAPTGSPARAASAR